MEPYVSIDIETTGLDPETCQILEIAAIIDFDGKTPIEELAQFNSYIYRDIYHGEAYALNMNANIFKEISKIEKESSGDLTPGHVIADFVNFLEENLSKNNKKYTPAGKNYASFDKAFLSKMPNWDYFVEPMLRHRTLDPGNLYWHPEVDGFTLPDTKKCLERAGLEPTNSHRALGDAIDVIKLIRYKFNNFNNR